MASNGKKGGKLAIEFLNFEEKHNLNHLPKRFVKSLCKIRTKLRDENHLLYHLLPKIESIEKISNTVKRIKCNSDTLICVGIGGSSLAGKVFYSIKKEREIIFFEGVEPKKIEEAVKNLDFKKCFLNIISKSGNTIETIINSAFLLKELKDKTGEKWKERVILTASSGEGRLIEWAKKENIKILEIPAPVGGRFSAFTAAGLLPAIYCGLDGNEIAKGVEKGLKRGLSLNISSNLSAKIANFYLSSAEKKLKNIIIWGYGEPCYLLSLWVQQLFAESLGKMDLKSGKRKGLLPVALKGSEDQHSILQFLKEGDASASVMFISSNSKSPKLGVFERNFTGLKNNQLRYSDIQNALKEGTKKSLQKDGFLVSEVSLNCNSEKNLAQFMTLFMISVLITSDFLKIDPFGQDGVEEGKAITKFLLT